MVNPISLIDHAVLHPTQHEEDVHHACQLCAQWGVASICVKPSHVPLAAELLADSPVQVSTVVGFPHGGTTIATKVAETTEACLHGAREIDMVVNLGKVLAREWEYLEAEVAAVVQAAHERDAITKVIFETGLLPDDELKVQLCQLSELAGAAFVKTSTGFGLRKDDAGQLQTTGATEHDVRLLRKYTSPTIGVKASGGIRSYDDAMKYIALGATRLGTSATATILHQATTSAATYTY